MAPDQLVLFYSAVSVVVVAQWSMVTTIAHYSIHRRWLTDDVMEYPVSRLYERLRHYWPLEAPSSKVYIRDVFISPLLIL